MSLQFQSLLISITFKILKFNLKITTPLHIANWDSNFQFAKVKSFLLDFQSNLLLMGSIILVGPFTNRICLGYLIII